MCGIGRGMKSRFFQGVGVVETVRCKCPRCETNYTRYVFYTGHLPMRAYCSDCTEQLFVLERPWEEFHVLHLELGEGE